MKIVALLPIKNEAAILRQSLTNIELWADSIIVADQASTDESREICKEFLKVTIIENPYEGHSNKVRWLLLDEARKIEGEKLIVCIDADEALPAKLFLDEINSMKLSPGDVFSAQWIQLWRSVSEYNDTGVWRDNYKIFAFVDDGVMDYERIEVINDHTLRIPVFRLKSERRLKTPLLHFQFVDWEKVQWKQAWYRCNELLAGHNARKINNKYASTLPQETQLTPTPSEWLDGIHTPLFSTADSNNWHREQILLWFREHGVKYFEPLQIWGIPELLHYFKEYTNREPVTRTFPHWLVYLNHIRNKIRSFYRTLSC